MGPGRRALLRAAGAGCSALVLPARAAAPEGAEAPGLAPGLGAERFIWIRNAAGEEVAVAYRSGADYDGAAMAALNGLFRDMRARVLGPLSPLLVDMLSVLQERWDYTRPILLRSGFRTPQTNAASEGAAPASLHLRGLAADIEVPGIAVDRLAAMAWAQSRRLGFMGIGQYAGFVHMDVGPQRVWTRLPPR